MTEFIVFASLGAGNFLWFFLGGSFDSAVERTFFQAVACAAIYTSRRFVK
jgi:hypothetical protein